MGLGGFPEWRARHLACAERGTAACATHLSAERTGKEAGARMKTEVEVQSANYVQ